MYMCTLYMLFSVPRIVLGRDFFSFLFSLPPFTCNQERPQKYNPEDRLENSFFFLNIFKIILPFGNKQKKFIFNDKIHHDVLVLLIASYRIYYFFTLFSWKLISKSLWFFCFQLWNKNEILDADLAYGTIYNKCKR